MDVSGELPPLSRGVYPVQRARVVSSWPFGIFRARVPLAAQGHIVVYPAPLGADGGGGAGEGDASAAVPVDGMIQPSGLREFRPGDDPRRIHWKASARKRGLVLLEWEGGTGSGPEVVLDRRAPSDAFEHGLRLLAGLALKAKDGKEPLKLHAQGLEATFGPGHRPWDELFEYLAEVQPLDAGGPPPPPAGGHAVRLPPDPLLRAGGAP